MQFNAHTVLIGTYAKCTGANSSQSSISNSMVAGRLEPRFPARFCSCQVHMSVIYRSDAMLAQVGGWSVGVRSLPSSQHSTMRRARSLHQARTSWALTCYRCAARCPCACCVYRCHESQKRRGVRKAASPVQCVGFRLAKGSHHVPSLS